MTDHELGLFAKLYDAEGTPPLRARLPSLHSRQLVGVLEKFAAFPRRLGDLGTSAFSTQYWNETTSQEDGTIRRDTQFPSDAGQWILSGPHFYVGNPLHQTPRENCRTHRAYDRIDLEFLPDDYLSRTNYMPDCSPDEYRLLTPEVPWSPGTRVTEYYRVAIRRALRQSGERTLIPTILPQAVGHIDGVFSIAMKEPALLVACVAGCMALPVDFFIKSTGTGDIRVDLGSMLPLLAPNGDREQDYAEVWAALDRQGT